MKKLLKVLYKLLRLTFITIVVIAIATTIIIKTSGDPDFKATNLNLSTAFIESDYFKIQKQSLPDYYRSEEQTILTIPEWYLVFNPNEYAEFLAGNNNPSDFPFMKSIDEYWKLYDRAVITSRAYGVSNDEYITMLNVIGISTTIEYMLKSVYENTIGRASRWTSDSLKTKEEEIIAAAHKDYSNEIYDKVWYVFDFSKWVHRLWTETSFLGDNFIRRTERKLSFTLEFGFKTAYAKLISYAAEATAEEEHSGLIYLEVTLPSNTTITYPPTIKQIQHEGNLALLSSPRWAPFTRALPALLDAGIIINNISGNGEIAVSYIENVKKQSHNIGGSQLLFHSDIVTNTNKLRKISMVKVSQLGQFLKELSDSSAFLEHIYDY